MTVSEAPDGWFIEYSNRYYHVNEQWLAEMYRHQVKPYGNNPAYNRLLAAFKQGADADTIGPLFKDFIENRQKPAKNKPDPTPFQEFIRGQRAARR